MSNEIKNMVNRFLGWRLPKDFSPDNGIKFTPFPSQQEDYGWPVGTNIFTADQAEAMLFAVAWPEIKQIQAENAALRKEVEQLKSELASEKQDYLDCEHMLHSERDTWRTK